MNGHHEKSSDALTRFSLSRHRDRPGVRDYAAHIFTDVLEVHGDRQFLPAGVMLSFLISSPKG